jgi:RNA polymerase sigma-70 factor (ECF subfamily)
MRGSKGFGGNVVCLRSPAIQAGVRAPLIPQAILGCDATSIASAFSVSPATMGQRLMRAKNRIRAFRSACRNGPGSTNS